MLFVKKSVWFSESICSYWIKTRKNLQRKYLVLRASLTILDQIDKDLQRKYLVLRASLIVYNYWIKLKKILQRNIWLRVSLQLLDPNQRKFAMKIFDKNL